MSDADDSLRIRAGAAELVVDDLAKLARFGVLGIGKQRDGSFRVVLHLRPGPGLLESTGTLATALRALVNTVERYR